MQHFFLREHRGRVTSNVTRQLVATRPPERRAGAEMRAGGCRVAGRAMHACSASMCVACSSATARAREHAGPWRRAGGRAGRREWRPG